MALISGLLSENGGNPESAILNRRSLGKHLVTIDAFDHHVVAQHIHER
jgi:hypothetical protein